MTTDTENRAKAQAQAQMKSIMDMVGRLQHARDYNCDNPDECDLVDIISQSGFDFDGYHNEEDALQVIYEHPLSVLVRSEWYQPGEDYPDMAAEFEILLCTGGPAVRIWGYLDRNTKPTCVYMEYQDWSMPWTFYRHSDYLLKYAQEFYFGG